MDRKIVYAGQIPLETDLLGTNQSTMIALGKLAGAVFGTGGIVSGLAVAPNTPAALNVVVAPGEIYSLQNLEATAYSSLPADTAHTCVKQGIQLDSVTLPCPAPPTTGFSISYLIEATYLEADTNSTALPYYNASNPTQAFNGPNNTGAAQATTRAGQVQLQVKAGIAATTGSQVAPAVDAGYVALAVVTVANGQTTIVAGNIVAATTGQVLGGPVTYGRLINTQIFKTSGTYIPTPGTRFIEVEGVGGGGAGGGVVNPGSAASEAAGGGSAGAYGFKRIMSGVVSTPVTIGSGGTAVAGAAGGSGTATSFGSLLTLPGGGGAPLASTLTSASVSGSYGGGSGVPTGADYGAGGMFGDPGILLAQFNTRTGVGGSTRFGSGGGSAGSNGASTGRGPDATGFGSGGSGAWASTPTASLAGGNGCPGLLIVREYA